MTDWPRRLPLVFAVLAALTSCSREDRGTGKDTVLADASPPGGVARRVVRGATWDTAAGAVFAIPAEVPGMAWLIDPAYTDDQRLDTLQLDLRRDRGTELNLISGGDSLGMVQVGMAVPDSTGCNIWPVAVLDPVAPNTARGEWRVAFQPGRVTGVAFDSLPGLSPADSARLTVAVARAASRLEDDTSAVFRGRPYVVRQASRFRLTEDRRGVLAEVVRIVPQEANPLHEQIVMILEELRESPAVLTTAYHERAIGLEEATTSVELLAVLRVPAAGRHTVLLRRDQENGFTLQLVEQAGPGRWNQRWRSAFAGC